MHNNKEDLIIIASGVSFPYGNASVNTIYTFLDGFQEHDCKGEVVCLYPNLPYVYKEISNKGEYRGIKYSYLSSRVHPAKNFLLHFLDFKIYPILLFYKYLKSHIKGRNTYVVFIDHVSLILFFQTAICKLLGAKVVLASCEYPIYLTKHPNSKRKYSFYSKYIDKYVFETKTLANFEKEQLNRTIESIIIPATMPFDDILECRKVPSFPYIAYSGSIHSDSKDGLSNIVKAFKIFITKYSGFKLKFIGRISNQQFYRELLTLVKSLHLEDKIEFTGEVDRTEYIYQMKNALLMVVAKPKNSYYNGGLSSKVIEYLFSGNPIIMTRADDYIHYLTHKKNVYFVNDNSPEELSNALIQLFTYDNLRNKIANNGKTYALENFNYHILTRRLLDFIRG